MNYGTMRKLTNTAKANTSSTSGTYSRPYEYEVHRLCQEQVLKQRQKNSSHIMLYRYLKEFDFQIKNTSDQSMKIL
jgi:hypothetical protein